MTSSKRAEADFEESIRGLAARFLPFPAEGLSKAAAVDNVNSAAAQYCLPRRERPRCEAETRRGSPCQRAALRNGRCANHGGLSTGPTSKAGKERVAEAQRRRWQAYRAAKAQTRTDSGTTAASEQQGLTAGQ